MPTITGSIRCHCMRYFSANCRYDAASAAVILLKGTSGTGTKTPAAPRSESIGRP